MKDLSLTKIFMTKEQIELFKDMHIPYDIMSLPILSGNDEAQSPRTATEYKNNKLKTKRKHNGKR